MCKLPRKSNWVKVIAALSFSKIQHYGGEDKIFFVCRLTGLCVFLSVPKKLFVLFVSLTWLN